MRVEVDELLQMEGPAILHWRLDHFVVFEKALGDRVRIVDPGSSRLDIPIAQLAEMTIGDQVKDALSKKAKLVVFGDADFANNQMIQGGFNRDLFLNSFNYLAGEEVTVAIRPKTWTSSTLEINESQRMVVYFASIFFIPELIMGLGVVIWLFRRSRA